MLKHTLAITMAVAAVSLATPGVGSAGVACTPHCAPVQIQSSNSGSELKGLNRANEVAGVHGADGRANAVEKQNVHKPGGSGVSTVGGGTGGDTSGGDTSGGDTSGGDTGGGDTGGGGPCVGC